MERKKKISVGTDWHNCHSIPTTGVRCSTEPNTMKLHVAYNDNKDTYTLHFEIAFIRFMKALVQL